MTPEQKAPSEVHDLTQGRISRQIVSLALPIIGTSFVQVAYSFTDMAWVGHLGSREIAALGVIAVLTWLAASIGTLVKSGAEVLVAHSLGAQNRSLARSYAQHTTTLALYIALGLMALLFVGGDTFIRFYHLDEEISHMAHIYLRLILLGLPAFFLGLACSGIYNATGRSKIPFRINSIGLIANMLLDPLFIFVFRWGIAGAALATVVSQWLVALLFLHRIYGQDHLFGGWHLVGRLHRMETLKIAKLGVPIVALNTLFVFITFIMGTLTARTGGHIGVATINTGGQLEAITWNTSQGFSTALATFVAQNYAQGKADRIFSAFKISISITSIFGLIASLIYIFLGTPFFALIVPEVEAYTEGGRYLRIVGCFQLFMMAEIVIQGLFYGTGRSLQPALISIIGNSIRIPLVFLFTSLHWGLEGIWWAIALSMIAKGLSSIGFLPYLRHRVKAQSLSHQTP